MSSRAWTRTAAVILLLVCVSLGVMNVTQGLWIHGKAQLAQWLIQAAWQKTSRTETVKPWPWADTWPAAKLQVPAQDVELIALQGIEGNSLAFGPGMLTVTNPADSSQTHVLAGHKDTHFRFLQRVEQHSRIQLENPDGKLEQYRVTRMRIVDTEKEDLHIATGNDSLVLITCYPFDSLSNAGPLRYVVLAEKLVEQPLLTQQLHYL